MPDEVELSEQDLTMLLHHDPLDPTPVVSSDSGAGPQSEPQTGPAPAAEPTPAPAPEPEPAAAAPEGPDLSAQIEAAVNARLAAMQPREEPKTQQKSEPEIPEYMLNIPDQIIEGMASEDPNTRRQATAILVSGVARTVHRTLTAEFARTINALRDEIPQAMQTMYQAREAQQAVVNDFYGDNPDLRVPEIMPVVYQEAMALAQKRPDLWAGAWNSKFSKELSSRVRTILKWQAPAGSQPPGPPAMLNGGARPAQENLSEQAKAIADLFG